MANRNFNRKQALEKEIKDIYVEGTYTAAVQATGTLTLTSDIVLTKVIGGDSNNGSTLTTEVEAAAANPTDTILVDVTGTADAIVITVTPNDGTNNGATPVDLTTAELVELINTGSVSGKTVTLTDTSSLIDDQTATGGDTTVLVDGGEGDSVVATFAGGSDSSIALITNQLKWGIVSLSETAVGTFRVVLSDKYPSFKMFDGHLISSTAQDINFQVKAEDVNGSTPYIDFFTLSGATATNPADGSIIKLSIELKNITVL